jgi:hypothetical protein
MDFLFHFQLLIGVIAPKSLSSAETDLVESSTVQQLWECLTTKKLIICVVHLLSEGVPSREDTFLSWHLAPVYKVTRGLTLPF